MKAKNILLALSVVLATSLASHAQVGIGTSTPNASAELDVSSTTKGFLPPRLTAAQRDAITSPAVGLVIFNTSTNCLNFYNGAWFETCGSPVYLSGSIFCASGVTAVVDVTNPTTGKIWMDRNLGASQVAASSTDTLSYGSLYQWGRSSDGHQCRYSSTTATLSSVDQPAHGNFILAPNTPFDWRSPQNDNLWQGVNGDNNPCPSGYRIPTGAELNAERASWSSQNNLGALASPLKLPMPGARYNSNGTFADVGTGGYYWASTVNTAFGWDGSYKNSSYLYFSSSSASIYNFDRAYGISVRCIKN
jgi:uncharacterized protein (TIGR02145 family)